MHRPLRIAVALVALGCCRPALAGVTPIQPFPGAYSDTFNQYSSNMAVLALPVFAGAGEIQMLSSGGSIKVEWSSSLGGDLVVPISGMMMGQLGIAQWVFDEPMCCFGGWMENNSNADDATFEFFGADGKLIDTVIADIPDAAQQWTWNGWQSDVPFTRIVVTGNGLINGFIWYENVVADPAPLSCASDVNGDGQTGVEDLVAVVVAWGTDDAAADVDGNGVVGVEDLVAVVLGWGKC
jgi:hypothetical protein